MTATYNSSSPNAAGNTTFTGNTSWSHVGPTDCRGVLVYVIQNGTTAGNDPTAVAYGGASLAQVALSPFLGDGGSEEGRLTSWFLGAGVPDGTKTVEITVGGTDAKKAVVVAYTASADTEVVDTSIFNSGASQANPQVDLNFTGRTAHTTGVIHSGLGAVSSIAPNSGFTDIVECDFGNQVASFIRANANSTDSQTVGWTATADEAHIFAVAVAEVAASGTDLVVQEAAHTQTSESPTLTQTHALTVQNAAHAESVDTLALTQVHNLIVQDTSQTQTADNLDIEYASGTLVVADALQSQTADELSLTQVHQLIVQDALHSLTSDEIDWSPIELLSAVSEATTSSVDGWKSAKHLCDGYF